MLTRDSGALEDALQEINGNLATMRVGQDQPTRTPQQELVSPARIGAIKPEIAEPADQLHAGDGQEARHATPALGLAPGW